MDTDEFTKETTRFVDIELVGVTFVPTIYTIYETGDIPFRKTIIGQLVCACDIMSEELRSQIKETIREEYAKQSERHLQALKQGENDDAN